MSFRSKVGIRPRASQICESAKLLNLLLHREAKQYPTCIEHLVFASNCVMGLHLLSHLILTILEEKTGAQRTYSPTEQITCPEDRFTYWLISK